MSYYENDDEDYSKFDFGEEAKLAVEAAQRHDPRKFYRTKLRSVWFNGRDEGIWRVSTKIGEQFAILRRDLLRDDAEDS